MCKSNLRNRFEQMTEIFSLAVLERLKACYYSNNNGRAPCNPIFVFHCPKSCLARCLAYHNYFQTLHYEEKKPNCRREQSLQESVIL